MAVEWPSECHRNFVGGTIENRFFLQARLLSASLRWAWLQGNSRARQLRSPVPALAGSVSPADCRLRLFEWHKQSALDPPKTVSLLGERPPFAPSVSRKDKGSDDYKTRTEWHRVISWNKPGAWAVALQKVEGELRYR
jgi:hypothetical protein